MTLDNPLFAAYVCLSFYFGGLMTIPIFILIRSERHGSILTPLGSLAYFWTLVMWTVLWPIALTYNVALLLMGMHPEINRLRSMGETVAKRWDPEPEPEEEPQGIDPQHHMEEFRLARRSAYLKDQVMTSTASLQLTVGKRYITRCGLTTEPIAHSGHIIYPFKGSVQSVTSECSWMPCGRYCSFIEEHRLDLVAECP